MQVSKSDAGYDECATIRDFDEVCDTISRLVDDYFADRHRRHHALSVVDNCLAVAEHWTPLVTSVRHATNAVRTIFDIVRAMYRGECYDAASVDELAAWIDQLKALRPQVHRDAHHIRVRWMEQCQRTKLVASAASAASPTAVSAAATKAQIFQRAYVDRRPERRAERPFERHTAAQDQLAMDATDWTQRDVPPSGTNDAQYPPPDTERSPPGERVDEHGHGQQVDPRLYAARPITAAVTGDVADVGDEFIREVIGAIGLRSKQLPW
jgi:hypothetical protein